MALKKIEMDVYLGEQDKWISAVLFMGAVDKFFDSHTQLKAVFMSDTLTGLEKFRLS